MNIADVGLEAVKSFFEFFTVPIRNSDVTTNSSSGSETASDRGGATERLGGIGERDRGPRHLFTLGRRQDRVCITSHASQCRTVDQVVVLPDGADAKGWHVSLSRAREAMHVYTRDKAALRQSVMQLGERKSVWELVQITRRSKPQFRCAMKPDLRAARQMEIVREIGMER